MTVIVSYTVFVVQVAQGLSVANSLTKGRPFRPGLRQCWGYAIYDRFNRIPWVRTLTRPRSSGAHLEADISLISVVFYALTLHRRVIPY